MALSRSHICPRLLFAVAFATTTSSAWADLPTVVTVEGQREPPKSASETTRDGPLLTAAPHRTASDLLLVVPGMSVSQHSGEGKAHQLFFRGFDAVHGQDLELWAGGAPVNDVSNIHGQGYADLHFLMPEVIRRVRSSPGTYDVRQGDFAVAGSISMDVGLERSGTTAKLTRGSFNSNRVFLAYRPPSQAPETFVAFEAYETAGFGPSRAARRTTGVAQGVVDVGDFAKLRLLATTYAGRYDSAGVLPLKDLQNRTVDRFATYDPNQGGSSVRSQLVAELSSANVTEGRGTRWSLAPYVVQRRMSLRADFTGYLQDLRGDLAEQIHAATTTGFRAFHASSIHLFSPDDTIEIGASGRLDKFTQLQRRLDRTDSSITKTEVNAKGTASDVAGYVEATTHPFRVLTIRAGVRVDGLAYSAEDPGGARSSQGKHTGPRATVGYRFLNHGIVTASYGEGFRSPQVRSLGNGETTPFTTVHSYELGARWTERRVGGAVSVFRTVLSEDLVFDQGTGRNERVPSTQRTGVAGDFAARPTEDWVASVSGTFTRAVFLKNGEYVVAGDLLPYAPQVVVRTDLGHTPTLGTLWGKPVQGKWGFGTSYVGRRPILFGEFGHDIFLVDATAAVGRGPVSIGLDVYNLLGTSWFDGEFTFASRWNPAVQPNLTPSRHVTVGPPRTLLATITLNP